MNILIAGCGYVGTMLGQHLAETGHTVWGLRRTVHGLPKQIRPLQGDLIDPHVFTGFSDNIHVVFYTASPDYSSESAYRVAYIDGLRNLIHFLNKGGQRPHILYTSSTAVYAQQRGEWVDELSPTTPEYFSGKCLLEGEQYLLDSGFPATVVRFAGIYGPGRTRLIRKVKEGSATYQHGQPRYANHIHRDDCVGILAHLMGLGESRAIYIGVDNEPIDRRELLTWLADELKAPAPQPASSQSMSGRETKNNKRCTNAKLVKSGYRFYYPTFRDGYLSLLRTKKAQQ